MATMHVIVCASRRPSTKGSSSSFPNTDTNIVPLPVSTYTRTYVHVHTCTHVDTKSCEPHSGCIEDLGTVPSTHAISPEHARLLDGYGLAVWHGQHGAIVALWAPTTRSTILYVSLIMCVCEVMCMNSSPFLYLYIGHRRLRGFQNMKKFTHARMNFQCPSLLLSALITHMHSLEPDPSL